MTIRQSLPIIIVSLGLALTAQSGFAASARLIPQDQPDQLHDGASAAEVTQALDTPETLTLRRDDRHSQIREISGNNDPQELIYVDLYKNENPTNVQTGQR